jgi:iron complex transport system substrate-binding protein
MTKSNTELLINIRFFLILLSLAGCNHADTNNTISGGETQGIKIVTLSPHLAEMIFNLDADEHLVGVSAYTDYPEEAKKLPRIGDAFLLDLEQLSILQPDIILAWEGGTSKRVVDELMNMGYRVEVIKSNNLEDISTALKILGEITGKVDKANLLTNKYLEDLEALRVNHQAREDIRVFFQIDERPLFTVGNIHYISEVIDLCGGVNIFRDLSLLAPSVSIESVISRDPEIILTSSEKLDQNKFEQWSRWPQITAKKLDNLFYINADQLERPTTRILRATEEICKILAQGRVNRSSAMEK